MQKTIRQILIYLLILSFFIYTFHTTVLAQTENSDTQTTDAETSTASTDRMTKEIRDQKQEELRTNYENKKEEMRLQMEERKQEHIASVEARRETFRFRVKELTDEEKQAALERIDSHLASANERFVEAAGNIGTKLEDILSRLEGRIADLEDRGIDTTEASAQLDVAQQALATAQAAAEEQATKEYVIDLPEDETGFKEAARATHQEMKDDFKAVKEYFKTAHDELHTLARMVGTLVTENKIPARGADTETVTP
ncbi:hypothetical protein KC726_04415 [Candidatus Woesebacteria bacterium]|nr:hypothetical protein [Candidatus Woesebacteria bacterium]